MLFLNNLLYEYQIQGIDEQYPSPTQDDCTETESETFDKSIVDNSDLKKDIHPEDEEDRMLTVVNGSLQFVDRALIGETCQEKPCTPKRISDEICTSKCKLYFQ